MHCRPLPSFSKTAKRLCPQSRAKPTLWPATFSVTPCMLYLPVCLVPALLHTNPRTPHKLLLLLISPSLVPPRPRCALPSVGDHGTDTQKWPCSFWKHWNRVLCGSGLQNRSRIRKGSINWDGPRASAMYGAHTGRRLYRLQLIPTQNRIAIRIPFYR